MSNGSRFHPSLDKLAAFDQGNLGPGEWLDIERHLARCASCCRQLETLPEDALSTLLRVSAGKPGSLPRTRVVETFEGSDPSLDTPSSPKVPRAPEVPPELISHPRYRVLGLLGAGGMGAVFSAEHRRMERVVALKVIRPNLMDNPAAVERFRLEVKAAARLAHPNIVTAHDADQAGDVHFLVMEYVAGRSLAQVVEQDGPQPAAAASHWVRQAALGLQHAFERGMVHRDIKPQNLLLTPEGRVKILDFGLARFARGDGPGGVISHLGTVVGTPDYMAPEQALDSRQADIRADIYSLGCTLYFLLAGQPPFPEGSLLHKLMSHQDRTPRPLREIRPDVPAALAQVLDRMLAKDPAQRFQTPAEVAEALAVFSAPAPDSAAGTAVWTGRHGDGPTGTRIPMPLERPRPGRRRSWARRLVWAGVACLLAVAGWFIYVDIRKVLDDATPNGTAPGKEASPEVRCLGGENDPYTAAAFSDDFRRALAAGADNTLRWWDLENGKELGRFGGQTGPVRSIALSPDGLRAVSAGADGKVWVWDLAERRLLRTLEGHALEVRAVAFTWDSRHAVSVGSDGKVILWDTDRPGPKFTLSAGPHVYSGVVLDRYGSHAASAGADGGVRLWDLGRRKPTARRFLGHQGAVACAAWSRDTRFLLSGGADQTVRFWRVTTQREVGCFRGHTGEVGCVALSTDNRFALSGSTDRTVRLWDVAEGKELACFRGHPDTVVAVAFSKGGQTAWSAGKDGTLRQWKLPLSEDLRTRPTPYSEKNHSLAITPDGKLLVMAVGDERVKLWDVTAKKTKTFLMGHTSTVSCVALTADGKRLASGSWDRTVKLWDLDAARELNTIKAGQGAVRAVGFAPDGQTLASGGADGTVVLWDVPGGKEKRRLQAHSGEVRAVAFSPDGLLLASAGADGTLKLWEVAAGRLRATLRGHAGAVNAVVFSTDGRTIASGGDDRTVKLWDVATGDCRATLKGHSAAVLALTVHPTGRIFVSGSADTTVQVWDAASGRRGTTFRDHKDPVSALAFRKDGRILVTGGLDLKRTAILHEFTLKKRNGP
jgi:WD40 repeat protein